MQLGVSTEQLTYGSSSLISDIGGFIGLLFGASLLGLVQMVEDWLKKVLGGRLWRKAQKQMLQQQTSRITEKPREAWSSPGIKERDDLPRAQPSLKKEFGNVEEKQSNELRERSFDFSDMEHFQVV